MTKEQAIELLIQAVQIGQQKGAYNLPSAKLIAFAVETLSPNPSAVQEEVEVVTGEKSKKSK